MKATVRIKKINGIEYWYEDTPYYDREKKQIRHKSKYLGKNIDNKIVRVRDEKMIPATQAISSAPSDAYTYGNLIILQKITQDLSILDILNKTLNETERDTILALAYNRVVRPVAMCNIQSWYEASSLWLTNPKLPLSSQRISEFLASIGRSNIPEQFMTEFCLKIKPGTMLLYDITSFTSHSGFIELLEYGHNRDGDGLPQLNFSLVVDKDRGIPVRYEIYPGSITDITTINNTIRRLNASGVENFQLIMDRGFWSQMTLGMLLDQQIPFIMPASQKLKSVKQLMTNSLNKVKNAEYLHKFGKETLFAMPVTLEHLYDLEEQPRLLTVKGYCFYDPKREQDDREKFYLHLHDAIEQLKNTQPKKWKHPAQIVREVAKGYTNYITWKFVDGKFEVKPKQNAITQRLNRMGKFILFYEGELDWMTCITLYRQRDAIEKCFMTMKKYLDTLPLNAQKDETVKGFLFVSFLGMILRTKIHLLMNENGLAKQFSVDSMLLELEKIKKFQFVNGDIMVSAVSKKNRTILETFNLCA
ncbi:MAG: IS1634 family transposase [Methanoregula sp.]|nr:IS1634 family transposase [Methanoregula sp.]